jgi:ABC-2 type transport system permease protein
MKYELRRLLFNKFFICLLVINGIFAWYTLTTDTIAGVAHTAPFSPWSFGAYLATVMPMIMLTVLFLLSFYFSKKEKQVQDLTSATPVDAVYYLLVRLAVVTLGYFLLCTLVIGMSFCFYAVFFDYYNYIVFLVPIVVIMLPCFVFILGLGLLSGRINVGFLYALMLVTLSFNFIQLPGTFDFFGKGFYSSTPMSMPLIGNEEPVFVLSGMFLAVRSFYFAIGAIMLLIGIRSQALFKQ